MKILAALVLMAWFAQAQTAPDVLKFFQTAAESLADDDEQGFFDHFDPNMPGFTELRQSVQTLLAAREVASAIEIVNDDGDAKRRLLQLDWVITTSEKNAVNGQSSTRRVLVKCKLERQGKKWKITAFEPLDLFKL